MDEIGTNTLLNLPDTRKLSSWAKFVGVMNIITGALSCLGIITAIYGVPLIIAGIKLLNAIDDLKRYTVDNDTSKITDTFENFHKYFKLTGIAYIVMICFMVLSFVLYGALFALLFSNLENIQNVPYQIWLCSSNMS